MDNRVFIERDRSAMFGYYIRVNGFVDAYALTFWGAKRKAKRYLQPHKRIEVKLDEL